MRTEINELCTPCLADTVCSRPLLVHHVARRLRLSRRMVRYLAETGQLRGFKEGRKIWQFFVADVEELRLQREARYV